MQNTETRKENGTEDNPDLPKGSGFFTTQETRFAALLATLGFEPWSPCPMEKVRERNGTEVVRWNFKTTHADPPVKTAAEAKDWTALNFYRYWKQDLAFIEENPWHPLAVAMCALKNEQTLLEFVKKKKTLVRYSVGKGKRKKIYYVQEGTRKHEQMKERYGY